MEYQGAERLSLTSAVPYIGHEIPRSAVAEYLDPDGPNKTYCASDSPRMKMYPYMLQEALEQELVLGNCGVPASAFAIAPAIASRKFVLPPTYIVHGT